MHYKAMTLAAGLIVSACGASQPYAPSSYVPHSAAQNDAAIAAATAKVVEAQQEELAAVSVLYGAKVAHECYAQSLMLFGDRALAYRAHCYASHDMLPVRKSAKPARS